MHFPRNVHYIAAIAALLLTVLTTACAKHEELEFSGRLIDIRSCSSLEIATDRNPAHIVALEYPLGVGGIYGADSNVVMLYEPTKHIRVDDHIHGKFYFDDKYSQTTCDWHSTDISLPEGVFVVTIVD